MAESSHQIWNMRFIKLIIDSMADGVFTMDARGKITSWNRSMEKISGRVANKALGKTCAILHFDRCIDGNCPTNFQECTLQKHKNGISNECMLRHIDGHDVPVIKKARIVIDEKYGVQGVVGTITDLTEIKKARQEVEEAARRLGEIHKFSNMIGKSREMTQVFSAIRAAAASDATVLVLGESGTGKELVAGAIHYNSFRASNPLVTVNCSALSETLLESELFGHVKGAFTGAIRDRAGRFEQAREGTIFLDEVAELSPSVQIKLLRVLQEREIERVGESKIRKIDIRVIAATHKDLHSLMHQGLFRKDLYYRLKVFPVVLPPLRSRKEDLPLLVSHFIRSQNKKTGKAIKNISASGMRLLMNHSWPGNVRELENAIEHAFVLCTTNEIALADLPAEIQGSNHLSTALHQHPDTSKKRTKITKKILLKLLDDCAWNKAEVARCLGKSRTSIWKYMKKWDIPLQKQV